MAIRFAFGGGSGQSSDRFRGNRSALQLLATQQLSRIESHLRAALSRLIDTRASADMASMLQRYVLAGGKRIRPQLCVWTHHAATGRDDLDDLLLDAACAWEIFHAFVLVHDDIIDNAARRRDEPALHCMLASLDSDSLSFGTNLGIVAGDLLYTAAFELLHELDIDADRYRRLLRLFTRVARQTGLGQAIDIIASHQPFDRINETSLLDEYLLKTAAYTFEGPMLSGAILAGLEPAACEAISTFSISIGQAYQLHNDLLDLETPCHAGCDLVQGKRTIALLRHRSKLDDSQRQAFDAKFAAIAAAGATATAEAETLRRELIDAGIGQPVRDIVKSLHADAVRAAGADSLPEATRVALLGLADEFGRRYFRV